MTCKQCGLPPQPMGKGLVEKGMKEILGAFVRFKRAFMRDDFVAELYDRSQPGFRTAHRRAKAHADKINEHVGGIQRSLRALEREYK